MSSRNNFKAVFGVIDAHDHPHGGRILRLRLRRGEAPSLGELKGGDLVANPGAIPGATPGEGAEVRIRPRGFAVFGGKVTDARLARTGRVDIHSTDEGVDEVEVGWEVCGPV